MRLIIFFLAAHIYGALGHRGNQNGRGFTSLFGQVQRVGDQLFQSVGEKVKEAGKVAQVLAGDAQDAMKTVATARIDDYIPNLEDDMNYLQEENEKRPIHSYRQSYSSSQGLVTTMLRMIGLDEHRLGMMALNLLVYMAEYLAKNVLGMESELENEIPEYRSIVQNEGIIPGMYKLVQDANSNSERIKAQLLDPSITEKMINETIPTAFAGTDMSCVQMFLCKMEPAFWSMQTTTKAYNGLTIARSLKSNFNRWMETVYSNLPEFKSLRHFGKRCNQMYPQCHLIQALI